MEDDVRRQIGRLFGDVSESAPLSRQDQLTLRLRAARETEARRIASQDQAIQQIQALAAAAGPVVEIGVPDSPQRRKKVPQRKPAP